ncbi:hypothetical protein GQ53DRAFT_770401 [Thozetella sp. PMI_491]|nr:hypothetical protein GQ53DRAFT_770401 [Thozetella sp. PMI_491]
MLLRLLPTVLAAIPLATAFPAYGVPRLFMEAGCIMPDGYEISHFRAWIPAAGNNRSTVLDFAYLDKSTSLETSCHLNATSKNVAKPGLAARYSCEDSLVHFIWQNSTLRMIETACPEANSSTTYEASGSLKPSLNCTEAHRNTTAGPGQTCSSLSVQRANFTSLQPSPLGS